jgi:aryl-alcohol dehydrogenase-like predicted oxidoreductase
MQYRQLGRTDLLVPEIGIGCARLGGLFTDDARVDNVRLLSEALAKGVTFFDTADMYSQGDSEALLGKTFAAQRHQVIIATKGGYCLPSQRRIIARVKPILRPLLQRVGVRRSVVPAAVRGALTQNFAADYVVAAAEQSLRRLRTDYIDVYQLHSPPPSLLESGDFLAPLQLLQRQGKIRHYGVACENVEDALLCLQYPELATVQVSINLLEQERTAAVAPSLHQSGVGVIARQCFASGLLARPPQPITIEARESDPAARGLKYREIMRYTAIAEQFGRALPELALRYVLAQDAPATVLLGIRTPEHLTRGLRYLAAAPLTAAELAAVRQASAAVPS